MASTLEMTREEWLAARRKGIGSSDAANAIGVGYETPFRLWEEKTGRRAAENLDDPAHPHFERVRFGRLMEGVIADEYAERTGQRVRRANRIFVSPDYPFMLANLDREVVGASKILECKNVDKDASRNGEEVWGPSGSDQVPTPYLIQVTHAMIVKGVTEADLAACIGGNELRIYPLRLDEGIAQTLIAMEREFWGCVEADAPPLPSSIEEARQRWPIARPESPITATVDLTFELAEYARLKREEKALKKAIGQSQLAIANFMGEHDVIVDDAGTPLLTYRSSDVTRFDVKQFREALPVMAAQYSSTESVRRMLQKGEK